MQLPETTLYICHFPGELALQAHVVTPHRPNAHCVHSTYSFSYLAWAIWGLSRHPWTPLDGHGRPFSATPPPRTCSRQPATPHKPDGKLLSVSNKAVSHWACLRRLGDIPPNHYVSRAPGWRLLCPLVQSYAVEQPSLRRLGSNFTTPWPTRWPGQPQCLLGVSFEIAVLIAQEIGA
jgi:hypothetical protein